MADRFIAWLAHWIIRLIQALPLRFVARCGRAGGALAWWLDIRHRKVMLENLSACFPQKSGAEVRALARENMRRLGENYACGVRTAAMSIEEVLGVCEVIGAEKILSLTGPAAPRNCIVAIGHFGNFELNAIIASKVPGMKPAATYRGLKQPALNQLLRVIRERSGCIFFERRSDAKALRNALNEGGLLLGLLSDQHARNSGVWGPFLGRNCSTTPAPAVLALRYEAALFTAICYRTALCRWTIEIGNRIPTHESARARSIGSITADINRAFEAAVLRDPANWFWVHNRWKAPTFRQSRTRLAAEALPGGQVMEIESP